MPQQTIAAAERAAAAATDAANAAAVQAQAAAAVVGTAVDQATQSANEARLAAQRARQALDAGDLADAQTQAAAAMNAAATALTNAAQARAGSGASEVKEEWQECRSSIDRFDKLLVDLRKTGFGLITVIVSGAAILLGQTSSGQTFVNLPGLRIGVLTIIIILILALYLIDRVHQVWLGEAVRRARDLEPRLNYQITNLISLKFRGRDAEIIGIGFYIILLLVTCLIFWAAAGPIRFVWPNNYQGTILIEFCIAAAFILLARLCWLR